jgi:hypothetical protein
MTYDLYRETVRFALRKIPFAFAVFGPRRGPTRNRPAVPSYLAPPARQIAGRKKLRKGGAKAVESWARVNLCAGPSDGPVWLALPAGRGLRPRLGPPKAVVGYAPDQSRTLSTLRRLANQAGPRSNLGDLFKGHGSSRRPAIWGAGRPRRSPIGVWSSQSFA